MPRQVPVIVEALRLAGFGLAEDQDFYNDPELRLQIFERDHWRCRYCGDRVTNTTATLDHIQPVSKGGTNEASNLATCCIMCNSIKSGRTYEEAAPDILRRLAERKLT